MRIFSLLLLLILLWPFRSYSQSGNLVFNPGFEEYNPCFTPPLPNSGDSCYSTCNYAHLPGPIFNNGGALYWYSPTNAITNYYKRCYLDPTSVGYQDHFMGFGYRPRTGGAYIVLQGYTVEWVVDNGIRSYAQVSLKDSLRAGCRYEVLFYWMLVGTRNVRSGSYNSHSSDGLGAYFSKDSFYVNTRETLSDLEPQVQNPAGNLLADTLNYQKIHGYFVAEGGEKYLTLGNFKKDSEIITQAIRESSEEPSSDMGTMFYIDDVSVRLVPPEGVLLDLGPDILHCDTSSLEYILEAQEGFDSYLWSTGETTQRILVKDPGMYWVEGNYGCGVLRDTIMINSVPPPISVHFTDTVICQQDGFSLNLEGPVGYSGYQWSTGATNRSIQVTTEGTYILNASHTCGISSDTVEVKVFDKPVDLIFPKGDTVICKGASILLQGVDGFEFYQWNAAIPLKDNLVSTEGIHNLSVISEEGCEYKDSVYVKVIEEPKVPFFSADSISCQGLVVALNVPEQPEYNSWVWEDGSSANIKKVSENGSYILIVYNICFQKSDTINIDFLDCRPKIPNLFTPNNDRYNQTFIIQTDVNRPFELRIFNRWGNQIYYSSNYLGDWDGANLPDGIYFYHLSDKLLLKEYTGNISIIR